MALCVSARAETSRPWWRRGWSVAIVVLALAAASLAGCADPHASSASTDATKAATTTASSTSATAEEAAATPSTFPLTVTDSDGRALTLPAPARAIISHSPGVTETLFAIGAGPQVIAADEFSNYPPETARLKRVAYTDPDAEAELALEPDLVIMSGNQEAQVEAFRNLGLPVLYAPEPDSIDGVLASITLLGSITGHDAEAAALVTRLRTRIDAVSAKLADVQQGPKVFFELSDSLFTVAPQSFVGSVLSTLKARNIAAGAATAFPQLGSEAVIVADPDVILLADSQFGATAEAVGARPGWSAIAAVRNGRVYPVDADVTNRPGPRIVDALEALAALMYPDRFP